MDLEEQWEQALETTEIIKLRMPKLSTFEMTKVPYIFLAESEINSGDTIVRQGTIFVKKPSIILPGNMPQFEGFEFEEDLDVREETVNTFFLVRGVTFPSLKFKNETAKLDIYEGGLSKAIKHFKEEIDRKEDIYSGLISGSAEFWQLSIIIYVGTLMAKSLPADIENLHEKFRKWIQ